MTSILDQDWTPIAASFACLVLCVVFWQQRRIAQRAARSLQRAVDERTGALERSRLVAEQRLQEKNALVGMLGHELRGPLSGVLGMTSLLLDGDLSADQRDLVENAQHAGEGLLDLLNDLLDQARMDAGRFVLDEIEFDPGACIEDAVQMFAPRAQKRGLELGCLIDNSLPLLAAGDPLRLRQVLTNLIGNAIKFTDHGHVTVRAAAQDEGHDQVRLIVQVEDTGIGIDIADQGRLFQPFTQAGDEVQQRFGGSGLGLSICRQLVERMGGRIDFVSTKGLGSTFHFDVLLRQRPQPQLAVAQLQTAREQRALAVQDPNRPSAAMAQQLHGLGVEVAQAADPAAATFAVEQAPPGHRFDAVLLPASLLADERTAKLQACLQDGSSGYPLLLVLAGRGERFQPPTVPFATVWTPVRRKELVAALVAASQRHLPGPRQVTDAPAQRGNALIADDDPLTRRLLQSLLQRLGFTTEVANDGEQALHAAQRSQFDVVLMDCQMPTMGGLAATAAIRAHEDRTRAAVRMPILALTASSNEQRDACILAGMDDFLAKPVTFAALEAAIRRVVGESVPGALH